MSGKLQRNRADRKRPCSDSTRQYRCNSGRSKLAWLLKDGSLTFTNIRCYANKIE
uniref:Uncharacterized protein n=1 Tax=Salmonella enterica subsp. salamae TaxID=59202 RepID=I3W476_SALER|nr:hypothetical protein [Salmonella enterica subsp. salamae]